jgi:four helix bundle protein
MQKQVDIHDRIYRFVIRVIIFTKSIPTTPQNTPIINQLIRSATSVGANDQEADGSITRKDFIHCYVIAKKEAKETYYWLSVIADINPKLKNRMVKLLQESKELTKIISSIILSAKKKV